MKQKIDVGFIALAFLAIVTVPMAGQEVPQGYALRLGVTSYDLAGSGTAVLIGAALPIPANRSVVVEPTISVLRHTFQNGPGHHLVFLPELTFLVRATVLSARLYFGAGGGFSATIGTTGGLDGTGHVAVGVDFPVGPQWRLGPELRARAIDPFHGSTADLTVRFTRRISTP